MGLFQTVLHIKEYTILIGVPVKMPALWFLWLSIRKFRNRCFDSNKYVSVGEFFGLV